MTELRIKLTQPELRCLRQSATIALRQPEQQARHLIRQALGLDPTQKNNTHVSMASNPNVSVIESTR